MISTLLMSLFFIFFNLLAILRISKSEKDLEILILLGYTTGTAVGLESER